MRVGHPAVRHVVASCRANDGELDGKRYLSHAAMDELRKEQTGKTKVNYSLGVSVHGPRTTSVQIGIKPRTGRGRGFALEWPKDVGRSHTEVGGGLQGANSGEGDRRLWHLLDPERCRRAIRGTELLSSLRPWVVTVAMRQRCPACGRKQRVPGRRLCQGQGRVGLGQEL